MRRDRWYSACSSLYRSDRLAGWAGKERASEEGREEGSEEGGGRGGGRLSMLQANSVGL